MYSKILLPIDLAHAEKMEKALVTAVELAKSHGSQLTMMGVTGEEPGAVAHDPKEYRARFEAFVDAQSKKHGITIDALEVESVDVPAELPRILEQQAQRGGYDVIVMASHTPGLLDHIFTSNAGHIATHSASSVFIVRG
jgi:nucleotide-binding universal stress UspA family protein